MNGHLLKINYSAQIIIIFKNAFEYFQYDETKTDVVCKNIKSKTIKIDRIRKIERNKTWNSWKSIKSINRVRKILNFLQITDLSEAQNFLQSRKCPSFNRIKPELSFNIKILIEENIRKQSKISLTEAHKKNVPWKKRRAE